MTATREQTITNHTLQAPGATIAYDIRPGTSSASPTLLLVGAPMGASGFPTLAGHFGDRTVVTYDPRGTERSVLDDSASPITPDMHADDLHRVIEAIGGGPVDMFASSGGAVSGLALVARHPDDVRTLVAHEPPLASLVPDREYALQACRAIYDTYMSKGSNAAMAHFMAVVSHRGPFTAEFAGKPGPDPQTFGMPADDDGKRDDAMLAKTILSIPAYEPDFGALEASSTRIVPAAGVESDGELARRGAEAVAERLGADVAIFPSGHGGFMGDEYGMPGDPQGFAAKLREVLDSES